MNQTEFVKSWADYLRRVRAFFDARGYFEVTTNCLVPSSAVDAALDTMQVSYSTGKGELQTSPEFEMKVVLAETKLPIYQICKSFRDDPPTPIHKKEFSMLEFYLPGATITETIQTVKELMQSLADERLDFDDLTVAEVVKRESGVDIFLPLGEFRRAVEATGVLLSDDDTWEDIFFKLMMERIEPKVGQNTPTILKDFPGSLSSLSKIEGDPPVSKRFEIYWQGMELCNGFNELTDVGQLDALVQRERQIRIAQGKPPHPAPVRLEEAMRKGIPESSGVAVGLDRLFTALQSIKR